MRGLSDEELGYDLPCVNRSWHECNENPNCRCNQPDKKQQSMNTALEICDKSDWSASFTFGLVQTFHAQLPAAESRETTGRIRAGAKQHEAPKSHEARIRVA